MSFEAPPAARRSLKKALRQLVGVPRRATYVAVYTLYREANGLALTESCRGLKIFSDLASIAAYPVLATLEAPELADMWRDHDCLGWAFQYLNDPDREALDRKINTGGKIEPHEIASKTQIFTERYMVEWLLQNSLGLTWLCMCRKHGWRADAESVLPVLEARRVEWRARREAGAVALDALMPIEGELEDHWKYFVPQPLPEDAIANAPGSLHALKILDPAVGAGAFLLAAYDHLVRLLLEQWRHESPEHAPLMAEFGADFLLHLPNLACNALHGIDLDPKVIPLVEAMLYAKVERAHRMLGNDPGACPPVGFPNLVCAQALPGTRADVERLQELNPLLPLLEFWTDANKQIPTVGSLYKSERWRGLDEMLGLLAEL